MNLNKFRVIHRADFRFCFAQVFHNGFTGLLWRKLFLQNVDGVLKGGVGFQLFRDLVHAVHNGGVIPAAQGAAHFLKGNIEHIPAEVHDHLAGTGNIAASLLGDNLFRGDLVLLGDHADDVFRSDGLYLAR